MESDRMERINNLDRYLSISSIVDDDKSIQGMAWEIEYQPNYRFPEHNGIIKNVVFNHVEIDEVSCMEITETEGLEVNSRGRLRESMAFLSCLIGVSNHGERITNSD